MQCLLSKNPRGFWIDVNNNQRLQIDGDMVYFEEYVGKGPMNGYKNGMIKFPPMIHFEQQCSYDQQFDLYAVPYSSDSFTLHWGHPTRVPEGIFYPSKPW
jgi:hypothetical protein